MYPTVTLSSDSIPDEAVRFILYQRTSLLRFTRNAAYQRLAALLPLSTYEPMVSLEARVRRKSIKSAYIFDIQAEFETIQPALPDVCASVLDIGCGIAGIDVVIAGHYSDLAPHFYLLDRTETERKVHYGFRSRAAFYNSLAVAAAVMRRSGVATERMTLIEANDAGTLSIEEPLDLIISLISWGFHYPVATYLNEVCRCLRVDGSLILDVRKGTDGLAMLQRSFADVRVILDTPKFERVLARRALSGI